MRVVRMVAIIMVVGFIAAGLASASHHDKGGSLDRGKALFNDPKLGTTGKSCNDCHANGKGLESAGSKKDLEQVVNACITQGIKGKALDVKSEDMTSLVSYVKSFGSGKKQEKKKPVVGC